MDDEPSAPRPPTREAHPPSLDAAMPPKQSRAATTDDGTTIHLGRGSLRRACQTFANRRTRRQRSLPDAGLRQQFYQEEQRRYHSKARQPHKESCCRVGATEPADAGAPGTHASDDRAPHSAHTVPPAAHTGDFCAPDRIAHAADPNAPAEVPSSQRNQRRRRCLRRQRQRHPQVPHATPRPAPPPATPSPLPHYPS